MRPKAFIHTEQCNGALVEDVMIVSLWGFRIGVDKIFVEES